MGFQLMGTDHLKARCICYMGDPKTPHSVQKGCPIHDLPVVVEDFDPVHRPKGYNSHPSGVQAIEVGRHLTADWFNAFKYVFRAEHKNGLQDLDKALWYANDSILHDIPVFGASWRTKHDALLQRIIDAEDYDARRAFFSSLRVGNRMDARLAIEFMIEEYPGE